ncbi:MAG: hypothetical protein IAF08_03665, partial [Rhizobacter sp.]|nr:hypothetical protein [Chlorobiales bacterium]
LWIAGETDGWTGADIEALCRKAASLAVRSSITRGKMPPVIMREHFEIALTLAQKQRGLK